MQKPPIELHELNAEQKRAVEFGDGPLLIIAGAGTGKTTVVTERIKYFISSDRAKPQEIVALAFTEKASREMEERVDMSLPYGTTTMWISTFHAFCDRILRNDGISAGFDPNYRLMTESETIQFFRKNLFKFELSYFRPLGNPTRFIHGMLQHFNRLKDEDVSPKQYLQYMQKLKTQNTKVKNEDEYEKTKELAYAYRIYEELKVKESVVDYADLITNTLTLLRTRKTVLKKYQDQFRYILIDEFQDTNYVQNELAILLAGKKQHITVVGDDDQAIYRFRGAAISNIIQFRTRFPNAHVIVLTKNYRSNKEILSKSYQMIQQNNPDRLEAVEKINKKLECMRAVAGDPISVLYLDRVENEADAVSKEIIKLTNKNIACKDIALLVRANNHADPFIRAFVRYGISYQFLGPGQLFRQPEIKDLIAYLKILYDIGDNVALYRVLSMVQFNISPRDIASCISFARRYGLTLFEACEVLLEKPDGEKKSSRPGINDRPFVTSEGEEKISTIFTLMYKHLGFIRKETAGQILYYFLRDSKMLEMLTSYTTVKGERIAEHIVKFFNKLKTYEADHEDASVFVVVDWLNLCMDLGESPLASDSDWSENNAVNILTTHSSKGLEFPVVFLVNLVAARFPTLERKDQIPIPDACIKELLPTGDYHLEEERRLFYVGMTRARDRLYLTAAKYYGEGKREKKLSPFIAETVGKDALNDIVTGKQSNPFEQLLIEWEKPGEEKEEKLKRIPLSRISYSRIETFRRCPLQYKYRYILRIPVPASAALSFGESMHKTVNAFYVRVLNHGTPSKDLLLTLFYAHWISLGYRNRMYEEKMKSHGRDLLAQFYERGFDPNRLPIHVEQPFLMKITPDVSMNGRIDRVDRLDDGKLEIIDYKTGSAPKKRDASGDFQLSVYALAVADPGIYDVKPEHVIVSFYFFEGNEKLSATRTSEQLAGIKKEIQQTISDIEKTDFHPIPGLHCDFCEFKLICEAWR